MVIHIGHSEMLVGDPLHDKVVYVEAKMEADVREGSRGRPTSS